MSEQVEREEYDVIIIGSGPSGLSAAISLKKSGINNIVVLEREHVAGGAPRHCGHPPYGVLEYHRLMTGPRYARRLVETSQKAGIQIVCKASVISVEPEGKVNILLPTGGKTIRAKRVLLATGAREMSPAARLFSGNRRTGICTTGVLQTMYYLHGTVPFRNPVIVGTELVSLSALWTCKKAGIQPAAIIETNPQTTINQPFVSLFSKVMSGLSPILNSEIRNISGTDRVEYVEIGSSGQTNKKINCDGVLFTGRFLPEASLSRVSHLKTERENGFPLTEENGRCSDSIFYAVGNLLPPLNNAVNCWRAGRRIGRIIAESLR